MTTNVLFVCLGNVCRSAMAEAIFKKLIKDRHLTPQFEVDSAGTSDEEAGHLPNPNVRKILAAHHLEYRNLHARQIEPRDFKWADIIIGMDHQNVLDLRHRAPQDCQSKIHLCLDILPNHRGQAIPDPWYTHRFKLTYRVLRRVIPVWLNFMVNHTKP